MRIPRQQSPNSRRGVGAICHNKSRSTVTAVVAAVAQHASGQQRPRLLHLHAEVVTVALQVRELVHQGLVLRVLGDVSQARFDLQRRRRRRPADERTETDVFHQRRRSRGYSAAQGRHKSCLYISGRLSSLSDTRMGEKWQQQVVGAPPKDAPPTAAWTRRTWSRSCASAAASARTSAQAWRGRSCADLSC